NVDVQVVIDALVADGQSELDAQVAAGSLTQAEADARAADLVQHATDQANGTFSGRGGHDGRGGPDGAHEPDADDVAPTASPSTGS
ncbi:MAG: hypothetical protein QOH61_2276, partial [Chloroflexota bacterium]|nr:hypothetical protein [Chloroflexota bacterium]